MKKILLLSIILNIKTMAFNFDIWESGISLKKAISISKSHDIALAKNGIIHSSKKFNQKLLDIKNNPNNRNFYYKEKLLGKIATIHLYFSQKSKKLYQIEIAWYNPRKGFTKDLYKILDEKYNRAKNKSLFQLNLFGSKEIWTSSDKLTTIKVEHSFNHTKLTYIDNNLFNQNQKEKEKQEINKRKKFIEMDKNKF